MEERRTEIRTIFDAIPEKMKRIQIKASASKIYSALIVDISFLGMACISHDKTDKELEPGKQMDVYFEMLKSNVKAKIVYCYPIDEARTRIGLLLLDDKSLKKYYNLLEKNSSLE